MNSEVQTALKNPQLRQRLDTLKLEPVGNSPAEFSAFIDEQVKRFAEIVKLAGVKPD